MNDELNPLSNLNQYTVHHMLVAFEFSEDAYTTLLNVEMGKNGTIFNASEFGGTCGGKAVVVVNEADDASASITEAKTTWNFFSPENHRTSSYVGNIMIHDRTGFLFTQKVKEFIDAMQVSIHHLTFAWRSTISGTTVMRTSEAIKINPMFFHVSKFTQSVSELNGRSYIMDVVACYNTHGTSPQFSSIQQNTVSSNNKINTLPAPRNPSSGIRSTKQEDSAKLSIRAVSNQTAGTMKTIKQFCDSFKYSLNNQTKPHKLQLQKFMNIIYDDYTDKISSVEETDELPLEYNISVDSYYKDKKIDNRNLPFEQTSQDQRESGVASITFPPTYNIHSAISQVMKMSKDIGNDHAVEDSIDTFKITTSSSRKCNGNYLINTKINKYKSPYNSINGENTGPGDNLITGDGIYYKYQDESDRPTTLMNITYSVVPQFQVNSIIKVGNTDDSQAIYGDREQPTSVRYNKESSNFFKNAFSGVNVMRGSMTDIGVQNSQSSAAMTNFNPTQSISYTLNIIGNPHLLGDINRNPLDVINETDVYGQYNIYSHVEYSPMYLKLKVTLGAEHSQSSIFYYDGFLHIYSIVTTFLGGGFTQLLHCSRMEENA